MRDNGRVAVPRMTDLVYLGQDGRSDYHQQLSIGIL